MGSFITSIRGKLLIATIIILVSSVVALVTSHIWLIREERQATWKQSQKQTLELLSTSVESYFVSIEKQLSELAIHSIETSLVLNPDLKKDLLSVYAVEWDGEKIQSWHNEEELSKHGIESRELISVRRHRELGNQLKTLFGKKKSRLVYNASNSPLLGLILVVAPVATYGEELPSKILVYELKLSSLIASLSLQKSQEFILLDSQNKILFSSDKKWTPTDFEAKEEEFNLFTASLKQDSYKMSEVKMKDTSMWMAAKRGLSSHPLMLLVGENKDVFLAWQKPLLWQSALIGMIIMVIALNLIFFFSSSVTKSLRRLGDFSSKVGRGEFAEVLPIPSRDEVGLLTSSFNQMSQSLLARENEISKAKGKLIQSEKMSSFGQASVGIVDEIKNPLAAILGFTEIIKKKLPPNSDVAPFIESIEQETQQCREIIENLMRYAQQDKAPKVKTDIQRTVIESIQLMEHQLRSLQITIKKNLAAEGAPLFVSAAPSQIQQVLLNLILNAQTAMQAAGTLTVSTQYDDTNGRVLVHVSDTGAGMDPETQSKIFEPFFSTKSEGEGTGLGLSVSMGIVKDHGGDLMVESAVGKGSTFTLSLPVLAEEESIKNGVAHVG